MSAKTMLTVEQFERLPETEGVSFELDQGELIEVSGPILKHNRIRDRFLLLLNTFARANRERGFAISEQEFLLSEETVRRPDVAFILSANLGRVDDQRSIQPFAPDLAIEIASPSDTLSSLNRKTMQYLNAGTKSVWIVVLDSQQIYVHSASAHPIILNSDENIEDATILPGFSIQVSDLFED